MIAPLDLTTEEFEVYRLLYTKIDFNTFEIKYTLDQIVVDSNPKLFLTKKKVSKIIKDFIKNGFLNEIRKGVKGKPTIYKMIKIKEQIGNEWVTNRERITIENTSFEEVEGTNRERIGNEWVTPINDIDKDKDNIYSQEKEIFDYWNSKKGVIHSQEKSFDKNKITTVIKKYTKEEIIKAIDRLDKAVLNTNYYYDFKWNIYKFFKQSNGISNWLDDGQLYNDYCKKNKTPINPSKTDWREKGFS